jgi:FkbM family methyltransferase
MIARSVWRTANLYPGSAFGKLVRLPLRLLPPNTEIPILTGPMRGFKWISDSSNATCWMGVYESTKQQAFARIVKPSNVVFDLGANVGFYTLLASRLAGSAGRVFSFEPSLRNVWYLRRHLRLNAIQNCQVIEAAVSVLEGIARFEISALPVTGHLTNEISGAGYDVETVSLDGLLGEGLVPEPNVMLRF